MFCKLRGPVLFTGKNGAPVDISLIVIEVLPKLWSAFRLARLCARLRFVEVLVKTLAGILFGAARLVRVRLIWFVCLCLRLHGMPVVAALLPRSLLSHGTQSIPGLRLKKQSLVETVASILFGALTHCRFPVRSSSSEKESLGRCHYYS